MPPRQLLGWVAISGVVWLVEASPISAAFFTRRPRGAQVCVQISCYKDISHVGLDVIN